MVEPGTILINKYRIERVLGQGGMGIVARAHHLQLNQPVAIKFLLPEVLDKEEVVQRFLREAQAAVRLKSEHVCRIIDVGTLDTGAPYMVMEYLDGIDLGQLLSTHGRPEPGMAVDFILQGCEALAEAHALGIVHRDVKPSNFFLTRRADGSPLIKILDFGISKAPLQVDDNLTSTQAILGTPAYMSPEQLRSSKQVDARADIWSLGVVLYELLAGHRPFSASVFSELCLKVAIDPVPMLEVPLPPGLSEVVMCCLQKDPNHRFRNVAELSYALAPYAQSGAVATSAVERTGRILGVAQTTPVPGSLGPGSGSYSGMPATQPGSRHFGVPQTQPGSRPPGAPPSTINATSGQVSAVGAGSSEIHTGRSRRPWLIAAVASVAVACGIAIVAVGGVLSPSGSSSPPVGASAGPDQPSALPAASTSAPGTPAAGQAGGTAPGTSAAAEPAASVQAASTPDTTTEAEKPLEAASAATNAATSEDKSTEDAGVASTEQATAATQPAASTAKEERSHRSQSRSRRSRRGSQTSTTDDSKSKSKTTTSGDDDILGTRQ